MKTAYYHKEGIRLAVLDLVPYYNEGFLITRINVPVSIRGRGLARKLLKECLQDADREGARLFIEISPSDGLDFDQLRDWYERNGFKSMSGIYIRTPVKVEVKT